MISRVSAEEFAPVFQQREDIPRIGLTDHCYLRKINYSEQQTIILAKTTENKHWPPSRKYYICLLFNNVLNVKHKYSDNYRKLKTKMNYSHQPTWKISLQVTIQLETKMNYNYFETSMNGM